MIQALRGSCDCGTVGFEGHLWDGTNHPADTRVARIAGRLCFIPEGGKA